MEGECTETEEEGGLSHFEMMWVWSSEIGVDVDVGCTVGLEVLCVKESHAIKFVE